MQMVYITTKQANFAVATLSFTRLGDHQATDRLFNYSHIYRLSYIHRWCLVTCRYLLKSSDRLFKMFLLRPFKIINFSSRHKPHFLCPVLHDGICLMISHLILCDRLLSFSCQIHFESSVSLRYFLLLSDLVWFRNLVLNSLAGFCLPVMFFQYCFVMSVDE